MNFSFSGVNIFSKNPELTFEFYKKLGFRPTSECEAGDEWYGATFALTDESDDPVIWIWRAKEGFAVSCNELVFSSSTNPGVDKLDELYDQFTKAGIECSPPYTAIWGGRELRFNDPDGNCLLFL